MDAPDFYAAPNGRSQRADALADCTKQRETLCAVSLKQSGEKHNRHSNILCKCRVDRRLCRCFTIQIERQLHTDAHDQCEYGIRDKVLLCVIRKVLLPVSKPAHQNRHIAKSPNHIRSILYLYKFPRDEKTVNGIQKPHTMFSPNANSGIPQALSLKPLRISSI